MNAQRNKKTNNGKDTIMRRALICLLLLIMATASNSYADVLIGDWEASTNEGWYDFPTAAGHGYSPDPDAWVDDPALQSSGEYAFDNSWSTEGSQSLRIKMAAASADNQWGNKVVISVMNDWFDNSILEMDVHSDGSWAQIVAINLNSQTFDTTHPSEGFYAMVGGWGTEVWKSGESAQHLVFDYSAFKGGEYSSSTDTYINLVFQVNGGDDANLYFDNVRLLNPLAHSPSPADGATGISLTPTLSWTAGDYAQSTSGHNVYLGTDFNDVNDANSADTTGIYLDTTTDPNCVITTPLTASTLYYWRVDEVNDTDGNSPWKGDVWTFNTLGNLTITKCQIKAGKTQGADAGDINNIKDSFKLAGTADFPVDANQITQLDVNIISVDDNEIIYNQSITDINAYLNDAENKFSYTHKITSGTAGAIYRLKLDFVNSKFLIYAKKVDLTGLGGNVKLELVMPEIGAIIYGEANETIVNGRKRIHTRLMRMYQDTLVVTKARAIHRTTASSDSLSVKGEIAVEDINNTDMNEPNLAVLDVNFVWGDQTFTVSDGNLVAYKTGHRYKCSKIQSDANDGVVTAKFDLDKCTFTLSVKEVNNINTLPDYPDVNFSINYGIGDANDFNETADVNLATRRSY